MTEIIEHRLKCDLCGHISPVIEHDETPLGWERKEVATTGQFVAYTRQVDFCTLDHYEQWKRINGH